MRANSRPVSSNQQSLHPRLATLVERHLASPYRRPVAEHSLEAYRALSARLAEEAAPLVLDSFCGTGQSTALLARRFPGHLVVGVDKSAHRLDRYRGAGENTLLLHANCEDIWQLLAADGLKLDHHYLLYPNPWPKAKHLQRRVHGHGSLSLLLALGGSITLRSNWQLYVEEFGLALHLAGRRGAVRRVDDREPISLFERKYRESGHALWQYHSAKLDEPAP